MKKVSLLLLLFIGIGIFQSYSQRFIGSVIAGANISQVDGDEVAGYYKAGALGGLSVTLPLDANYRWFGTIELLYSQKGAYQTAYRANAILRDTNSLFNHNEDKTVPFNPKIKYKLNLDYVEVPIVFHYEDFRTGWAFGAGIAWGRLVRAHEIENGWTTTTSLRSKTYKSNDWSIIADVKFRIYKGLRFNFRFQYSLAPLRVRDFVSPRTEQRETRKQYNNVLSVRLIYSFNEKFIRNPEWVRGGGKGPRWIHDTSKGWYSGN